MVIPGASGLMGFIHFLMFVAVLLPQSCSYVLFDMPACMASRMLKDVFRPTPFVRLQLDGDKNNSNNNINSTKSLAINKMFTAIAYSLP